MKRTPYWIRRAQSARRALRQARKLRRDYEAKRLSFERQASDWRHRASEQATWRIAAAGCPTEPLQVQMCKAKASRCQELAEHYSRRQESAHRRVHEALKRLAQCRKMQRRTEHASV